MAPRGGLRGEITGWSPAAVRRHKRWLYGVVAPELDGVGDAVTLTMRDTPASHEDWQRILIRLFQRLRDAGMIRWHWVVEWQRRGTPHLHMAVYGPEGSMPGYLARGAWLDVAAGYGLSAAAQRVTPITGPVGWLKYLSKHASRGVAHYQRHGKPAGWTKTGRLWGYGGSWPSGEPIEGVLTQEQYVRVRRMVRRYAIASARAAALHYREMCEPKKERAAWASVSFTRRMLRCGDPKLSWARGVSEWVPAPVFLEMAGCAGWQGEMRTETVGGRV